MKLTREFIFAIAPSARPEYVSALVQHQAMLTKYGITSIADVCHFLAQCAAETMAFNRLEESLYYTTIKRIRAVWPSRFKSDAAAAPFVRQPQKLANSVYAGRLGNTGPDDGWAYRGSSCAHTTGKYNFSKVRDAAGLNCIAEPELLRVFPAALEAACVFWQDNKLSRFTGNVTALTKAWQGGSGALADRKLYTARALEAAEAYMDNVPAPIPAIPASKLLRNGGVNSVNEVKALQQKLTNRGYDVGRIDGIFGDSTERGVTDFQRDNGLIADGVAGPLTIKALNANAGQAKVPPSAEPSGLNRFLSWLMSFFTRA